MDGAGAMGNDRGKASSKVILELDCTKLLDFTKLFEMIVVSEVCVAIRRNNKNQNEREVGFSELWPILTDVGKAMS